LDKTKELGEIVTDILVVKLGVSILISRSATLYLDLIRLTTLISVYNIYTKVSWVQVAENYKKTCKQALGARLETREQI
jgi:hypothetical protein